MPVRIGRILIFAVVIEVLAILALVAVVALTGPRGPDAARLYAEQVGYWLGPLAGFVLCLAGAWLLARRLSSHQVLNGVVLGLVVAIIDVVLLVAGKAEFQLVLVVSNVGRIVAGAIGGWLASRGFDQETDVRAVEL